MISFDTNILIYAHRSESPFHARASASLREAAESPAPWALTWTALHEFLAIVTNPRIFQHPTPLEAAIRQVDAWLLSPSLVLLTEPEGYWLILSNLLTRAQVVGGRIHDARIAALALAHEIQVLRTADRDFSRFVDLKTENPVG